jgi:hypothetical protein
VDFSGLDHILSLCDRMHLYLNGMLSPEESRVLHVEVKDWLASRDKLKKFEEDLTMKSDKDPAPA